MILAERFRSDYATGSASMQGKALALMKEAARMKEKEANGEKVNWEKPFKTPWGIQKDGDLWQQAWIAILQRGPENQPVRKVKGHATQEDVEAGVTTEADKTAMTRAMRMRMRA